MIDLEKNIIDDSEKAEQEKREAIYTGVKALANDGAITDAGAFYSRIKQIESEAERARRERTGGLLRSMTETRHTHNQKIETYPLPDGSAFGALSEYNIIRDGLITIGGDSSGGKTSFATHLIIDILRANVHATALFYSLDDSTFLTERRVYAQLTGTPMHFDAVAEENLPKDDILSRLYIHDTFNANDLRADIAAIKARLPGTFTRPLVVIALDYLQYVRRTGSTNDDREWYNTLTKALKDIQKETVAAGTGCIIIMLSQMNRDENKSDLNRFRETSEIENVSDVAFVVDYKKKKVKEEGKNTYKKDTESTERKLKVVKNKIGTKASFKTQIEKGLLFAPLQRDNTAYTSPDDDNIDEESENTPPEEKTVDQLWGKQ